MAKRKRNHKETGVITTVAGKELTTVMSRHKQLIIYKEYVFGRAITTEDKGKAMIKIMKVDVPNTMDILKDYAETLFVGKNKTFNGKTALEKIKEIRKIDMTLSQLYMLDKTKVIYDIDTKSITDSHYEYSVEDFEFDNNTLLVFKHKRDSKYERGKVSKETEQIKDTPEDSTPGQQANVYEGVGEIRIINVHDISSQIDLNETVKSGGVVLGSRIFEDKITFILGAMKAKVHCTDTSTK